MNNRGRLDTINLAKDQNLREIVRALWRPRQKAIIVYQPDHEFSVGTVIKPTETIWVKALADTEAHANATCIVTEVIDSDNFTYTQEGVIYKPESDPPEQYIPGAKYFLSVTTAGEMFVQTTPEAWVAGEFRQFLGTGTPDGGFMVEIDEGAKITINSPQPPEYWRVDHVVGCILGGDGFNTGYQTIVEVQQHYLDGILVDVVPENSHARDIYNPDVAGGCPLKPYRASFNLSQLAFSAIGETEMSPVGNFTITTPAIWNAINYLFLSIPAGKTKYVNFFAQNSSGQDITDTFTLMPEQDVRAGERTNDIWRIRTAFSNDYTCLFRLTIY